MDPNQLPQPGHPAAPAPQASQSDGGQFNPGQYDFITNPQKPPKKGLMSGGTSKKQRILLVIVGLVSLLILFMLTISLLSRSNKASIAQLTTVMQQQVEIIRVSDIGTSKAGSERAKAIANKTHLTIATQQRELQSTVKARKIEIPYKELSKGKNPKTDQTLNTAAQNGRFDDAFIQTIRTSLEEYQKSLKSAHSASNSKSIKDKLNTDYKQVTLLLEDITNNAPSN
jgi:hypothetical protein